MTDLTLRQQLLLTFIADYQCAHGCAPSMREMAVYLGCSSTNGVFDHLGALEKKGAIRRTPGIPRAIKVLR